MKFTGFEACLIALLALAFVFGVWPFVFMLAWNAFVPSVFGGPTIEFYQALAATILANFVSGLLARR